MKSHHYLFLATVVLCSQLVWADGKKNYVQAGATAVADGSAQKPFPTIKDALKLAKPGDSVIVRAGVYREQVTVPSGAPGALLTLMAEPGQRVIVSGFAPISGWQPFKDKIFVTNLDWKPDNLYVNATRQPMSHEPNEGWYPVEGVEGMTISDPAHLSKRVTDMVGGHAQFFQRTGIVFFSNPIVAQDTTAGNFTFSSTSKWLALKPGDKYILKNRASLIDQPGEWAAEPQPDGKTFKVYFWPVQSNDLKATQAPRATRRLVFVNKAQNVRLEGLEVAGCTDTGIDINNSSDVTVTRCLSYSNGNSGINVRGAQNVNVSRNIVLHNYSGITMASVRNATVEENEVAYNIGDGVDIAGDISGRYGKPEGKAEDTTDNVTVRRNYVHHHLLWGHPDNLQLYRGVKNINFIENVAVGGGQGLMTEEVDGAKMEGNVFLSSAANLVILGHGNSNDWTMRRNTFAFPGYSIYSFTGKNYDARENVYLGGVATVPTYTGDYNLYGASLRSQVAGQDANSQKADPLLTNVPKAHAVSEEKNGNEATADTLYLRGGTANWKVGENIEVNWDGVRRQITASDGQKINFKPALPVKPFSQFAVVVNWGDKTDFTLDTRPLAASPALKLSAQGGPIGSTVNIADFQRGDFDGDGKRDLPELPADVKAGLPDPNNLIPPSY